MSSRPSPTHLDLTGLEGDYVIRGWTRPRVAGLITALLAVALLLITALLLQDRQVAIWAILLLASVPVGVWRMRGREVTTTISQDGITIDHGSGQRGRVHLPWTEVREVYVAGAWQIHSSLRTAANEELSLPGLDRAQAARLARVLRPAG